MKPKQSCNSQAGLVIKLLNAITESVREMERHPDDSTQDIWNESLESWGTGLWMNHRLEIKFRNETKY